MLVVPLLFSKPLKALYSWKVFICCNVQCLTFMMKQASNPNSKAKYEKTKWASQYQKDNSQNEYMLVWAALCGFFHTIEDAKNVLQWEKITIGEPISKCWS